MKYCINCGYQLPKEASFCSSCGAKCENKEQAELYQKKIDELYVLARESFAKRESEDSDDLWIDYYYQIYELDGNSWEAYFYTLYLELKKKSEGDLEYLQKGLVELMNRTLKLAAMDPLGYSKTEICDIFFERMEYETYYMYARGELELHRATSKSIDFFVTTSILIEALLVFVADLYKDIAKNNTKCIDTYKVTIDKLKECREHLASPHYNEFFDDRIRDIEGKILEIDPQYESILPQPKAVENEPESSEAPIQTSGKCRNCGIEIQEGTLCKNCLKSMDQEQLTAEERKQKNELQDTKGCLLGIVGCITLIVGIITLFTSFWISLPWFFIGITCIVLWLKGSGTVCENCQRKNTLDQVNETIVGTHDTYLKEKRQITQTRTNGLYTHPGNQNKCEMEVDVPATIYRYEISYKCRKCGHIQFEYKNKTVKK